MVQIDDEMRSKGVEVLAFPCNQFGSQESKPEDVIQDFVSSNFDPKFRIFEKIKVKGPDVHPVFKYLNTVTKCEPRWNFTKYLVNLETGKVEHYDPKIQVAEIIPDIQKIIGK